MKSLPSFDSLRAFEAAARLLSFQAAAAELGITPSAVSHRIKKLEGHLELKLFDREIRSLSLTAEGQQLVRRVRRIIGDVENLTHSRDKTTLSINVSPVFFKEMLMSNVSRFNAENPGIELDLHISQSGHRVDRHEVAIRYGRYSRQGWRCSKLMTTHLVATCAPEILAKASTLRDVLELIPRIDYSYAPNAWRDILRRANVGASFGNGKITVDSMEEGLSIAKAGLGVALGLQEFTQGRISRKELSNVPGTRTHSRDYYFAYKSGSAQDHSIRVFHRWLLDTCSLSTTGF